MNGGDKKMLNEMRKLGCTGVDIKPKNITTHKSCATYRIISDARDFPNVPPVSHGFIRRHYLKIRRRWFKRVRVVSVFALRYSWLRGC
jgi:hypothetical protein